MLDDASRLRELMVDRLVNAGTLTDPSVEAAMRTVKRDAFVRHVPVETAYSDGVVCVKAANGVMLSTASQPTMVALMLEQLRVPPRARVLEIGTGSGYNAALLAELAGPDGNVITIDIEPDLVAAAARQLTEAGYANVRVLCADGTRGYALAAPYDRIIVTASGPFISRALYEQLRDGGLIVAPLGGSKTQRSMAFERYAGGLREMGAIACTFIPLRHE